MPKNFYLDPITKDLVIQDFNLRLTATTTEWLSQKIENRLKTFYGEWFADATIGIKYFRDILKKQPNLDQVNTIFRNAIINTEGVQSIDEFNVDFNSSTRTYQIDFVVTAEDGETVESSLTI